MRVRPLRHRETEIKLTIQDLPALVEKLKNLRAKPSGRVLEQNTMFDTDADDLRLRGMLLRVRTETPAKSPWAPGGARRMVLTVKSPAPPSTECGASQKRYKEKFEQEVVLDDLTRRPRQGKRTLRDRGWPFTLGVLGFRAKFRYEKYRTPYTWQKVHLDLDETPVGNYLELEGEPGAIDDVAAKLGYGPLDYIRENYFQLYAAEQRRRGQAVKNMLFR